MKTLTTHDIAPARIDKALDHVTDAAKSAHPYIATSMAAVLAEEILRLRKLAFALEAARIGAEARARQPELALA